MRRPKTIQLCGHVIRIDKLPPQGDEKCVGLCMGQEDIIYIEDSLPDAQWNEILWHEALHFIEQTHGLRISHGAIYTISNELNKLGFRL